jgi:hypothetical protein
VSPVPL